MANYPIINSNARPPRGKSERGAGPRKGTLGDYHIPSPTNTHTHTHTHTHAQGHACSHPHGTLRLEIWWKWPSSVALPGGTCGKGRCALRGVGGAKGGRRAASSPPVGGISGRSTSSHLPRAGPAHNTPGFFPSPGGLPFSERKKSKLGHPSSADKRLGREGCKPEAVGKPVFKFFPFFRQNWLMIWTWTMLLEASNMWIRRTMR